MLKFSSSQENIKGPMIYLPDINLKANKITYFQTWGTIGTLTHCCGSYKLVYSRKQFAFSK